MKPRSTQTNLAEILRHETHCSMRKVEPRQYAECWWQSSRVIHIDFFVTFWRYSNDTHESRWNPFYGMRVHNYQI